jgi:peptidoglycan/xylan/chitin deacetylase (PgdA/CDA1 family)
MTVSPRQTLLRAARTAGLFSGMRSRHRRELLVLTYHSVVEDVQNERRRYPLVYRNAVSAGHFEQQMRYLRRHYSVLDGDALRTALAEGRFPDRAAVVTFDDGLLNNATVALPILHRLGVPALFFLPTGFLDAASEGTLRRHWTEDLIARLSHRRPDAAFDTRVLEAHLPGLDIAHDALSPAAIQAVVEHLKSLPHPDRLDRLSALTEALGDPPPPSTFPADADGHSVLATMTWDQARRAANQGITLGGHTVTHESLARLPDDDAAAEITGSLQAISENTGQAADFFSYPYGRPRDFTAAHQAVLADAGCRGAFTQVVGFNDASSDPLALRRVDVSPDYSLDMFAYVASGTKKAVDRVVRGRSPASA